MVTEYGMSEKIGPVSYGNNGEIFVGRDYQQREPYSEDTAKIIDNEIRLVINDAYEKAVKMLSEHRDLLDTMARLLIERETIYGEEVDMVMAGKSVAEILDYIEHKESANPLERAMKEGVKTESKPVSEEKSSAEADTPTTESTNKAVGPSAEAQGEKSSKDESKE